MRLARKSMFLLMFGLAATVVAAEFVPGFDSGKGLPEGRVYPQGRIFPFSGFAPSDLARAAQAGYTMVGPAYSDYQLANLREGAERENLFMIWPLRPEADGAVLSKQRLDAGNFDPAPYWKNLARQVRENAGNRRIAWWYLMPEELRPWRTNDMEFLKGALHEIRANDPEKRPVWLYLPNHYTREQMRVFAENLDVIGKGMYPVQLGKENDRVWCRWSTEAETGAILDAGSGALPIAVPEMFKQPGEAQLAVLEKLVRHDIYLSLVAGAKGVVVFSLAERPGFPAHNRYFEAYAGVARELTEGKKLGDLFLFGQRLSEATLETLAGPATLSVDAGINGNASVHEYPAVAFAEIGFRDTHALFLVNSSREESVKLRIGNLPSDAAAADLFTGEKAGVTRGGALEVELSPYEVKAFELIRN